MLIVFAIWHIKKKKSVDISVYLFPSKANPHTDAYDSILSQLLQASGLTSNNYLLLPTGPFPLPLKYVKNFPSHKTNKCKSFLFSAVIKSKALSYFVFVKLL